MTTTGTTEPTTDPGSCRCERPLPQERPERKGVGRTYCRRCERPLPLRLAA